jgi:pentatricopeptide repeat protein
MFLLCAADVAPIVAGERLALDDVSERRWPLLVVSAHGGAVRQDHMAEPYIESAFVSLYVALGDTASVRAAFVEIVIVMVRALAVGGDVDVVRDLFDGMPLRDDVAWNAMIAGYMHMGRLREALRLLDEMRSACASVGEVMLTSVLKASAQIGALDHGRWVHRYMCDCGMWSSIMLGTALVDMYSKCGAIAMAMEVFESMSERDVHTWTSALNGLETNDMGLECLELFKRMETSGVQPHDVTFVVVLCGCSQISALDRAKWAH